MLNYFLLFPDYYRVSKNDLYRVWEKYQKYYVMVVMVKTPFQMHDAIQLKQVNDLD